MSIYNMPHAAAIHAIKYQHRLLLQSTASAIRVLIHTVINKQSFNITKNIKQKSWLLSA